MKNRLSLLMLAALKGLWKLVVSLVVLLLAALLVINLGDFVFPSTILVRNESGMGLRDVSVFGQAGVLAPADMGAGQSRRGDFGLTGASAMELRFTGPDGKTVSKGFSVAGLAWARKIEVVITPDLNITRKEK